MLRKTCISGSASLWAGRMLKPDAVLGFGGLVVVMEADEETQLVSVFRTVKTIPINLKALYLHSD